MSGFPYQIVAFLDKEPSVSDPVYYGEHGWYPQIALKRRFKLDGLSQEAFVRDLGIYFSKLHPFELHLGELAKPERMPVQVVEVNNREELKAFHLKLIENLDNKILSRYPERDGQNYYPHITAEYNGEMVIKVEDYTNKTFNISTAWLLKDNEDDNSMAIARFRLGRF